MEDDDFNNYHDNYDDDGFKEQTTDIVKPVDEETKPQQQPKAENNQSVQIDFANQTQDNLSPFNLNFIEQSGIYIIITDSSKEGSGISKHVVYTIKGTDKHGDFESIRRYNEFDSLFFALSCCFPGHCIPPIPEKKISNKSETFIEDRKKFLQHFLNKVATREIIYYSEVFQEFIRSKDSNIAKRLDSFAKDVKINDILTKYQECYTNLKDKDLDTESQYKITTFTNQLKKTKNFLQSQQDKAFNIATAKQIYNLDQANLQEKILSDFEELVVLNYNDYKQTQVFFQQENKNELMQQTTKQIKDQIYINSFEYFQDLIRFEINDITSMVDALQEKENYEKKIMASLQQKTSIEAELSKLFLKKGKNDKDIAKIDQQIEEFENKSKQALIDTENLKQVKEYINLLLVHQEIDKFKNEKKFIYHRLIKIVSEIEISSLRNQKKFYQELENQAKAML